MDKNGTSWCMLDVTGDIIAENVGDLVNRMISFSEKARRDGLLALEEDLFDMNNRYCAKLMQLVVDGCDPEIVSSVGDDLRASLLTTYCDILSLLRTVCENVANPNLDVIFVSGIESRNLMGLGKDLREAREFIARCAKPGGEKPDPGVNAAIRLLIDIAAMQVPEVEKHQLYDALLETASREADRIYRIILKGVLGAQMGENPRIIRERLNAIAGIYGVEEEWVEET